MNHTTVVDSTENGDPKKISLVDGFGDDLQVQFEHEHTDFYIDLWKEEVIKLRDSLTDWLIEKGHESAF